MENRRQNVNDDFAFDYPEARQFNVQRPGMFRPLDRFENSAISLIDNW